ncbi:MAG: MFS transporter [Candidatus Paceibacterota bacterium]|jgi:multidrug resistance protein
MEESTNKFKISPKSIILATVFLDVLGIGLVVPILPFYVESFQVSDFVVTLLFAVFSLFAFFSAPILGMLSDRKGRRPVLLISLASSALGWLIFAFSNSIWGLFLGRIIDGSAAGNISTAQNYLIDMSKTPAERTKNLGLIGAIFGIGFIIGPVVGGLLSGFNMRLPFVVVGILATVNTVLAYFFLPETHHQENRSTKKISINPFAPIVKAFANKEVLPLYMAWLFFGIAISLNQSIFALYINRMFAWGVIASGLLMALMGVILALNQAVLIHKVWLKYFKESFLLLWIFIPFALGYFAMALPFKFAFMLGLIITAFGHSTLRVVMSSQIIGFSDKKEQGEMMGILTSFMSLSMILGPMIGGAVYVLNTSLPFTVAGIFCLVAFMFVYSTYKKIGPREHLEIPPVEAV